MTLNTIFAKPIDRPIEGVIKADDDSTLRNEIEEYVITNELEKRLEGFFSAYHNYEGANGVWISGFFGSGKSHLLKMLALLLENRNVEDLRVADSFVKKCPENNQFLAGELQRVVSIPSQSILFNIDQKADVISKNQIDALLAVFVKVFDETCGYYGKQGHIAKFERDLDSRELYKDFKIAYKEISGKSWDFGREQAIFESHNIAQAYGKVTNSPLIVAQGILDKYRAEYKVSIEDFAQQVKEYIDQQPPNFRLNFFVDEVGQYIANNVKLMTNLQTIAESLATKCRGRAWIIVTAQEEMDNVIGEQSKQQTNDFSKIQARFANRMKLTSNDVAEVIQKRLLSKNLRGVEILSELYRQQVNNFKTLFDFTDGSTSYKNFRDLEHFVATYPFIPYQFDLFQSAIQNLSIHNAFEGKHSSVGERSMLGVFQQVAITIRDYQVGQLATFDLMFEGISAVLKSNTQRAISVAQNNLDNPFAVRLLKVLFLVKYVQPFRSTLRNLTILMLDSFDCNVNQLQKQIQESLSLLEQQTYIQRNGEIYEYLTDEEKDIEEEIKNTQVDKDVVNSELGTLIFDHVIRLKKVKNESNQQEYFFSRKMDNSLYSREYEIGIHFITPFNDHAESLEIIKAQAMGTDDLFVVIPADDFLIREVVMYKQTEKYLQQNLNHTDKPIVKTILGQKQSQNSSRYQELQNRLKELLVKAIFIINGGELDIKGEDISTIINKGFQDLIIKTYPNLTMLRGVTYNDSVIKSFIYNTKSLAPDNLAESEFEVFSYIQNNQKNGLRSNIKDVVGRFGRKPYGWDSLAVVGTIAKLITYGKLEARQEGSVLKPDDLEVVLLKAIHHPNVILEPQVDFSPVQVRNLREFYSEFFHKSPTAGEAKPLAEETRESFKLLIGEMETYVHSNFPYPFRDDWLKAIAFITPLVSKSYDWFLTDLSRERDDLLDLKEDIIDPIFTFLNSKQKEFFDDAFTFIDNEKTNLNYLDDDYYIPMENILNNPKCFRGNIGQELKHLLETLKNKLDEEIKSEINQAHKQLHILKDKLLTLPNFIKLSDEQKQEIILPFTEIGQKLNQERLIPVIRDTIRSFESDSYTRLLEKVDGWVNNEGEVGSGECVVGSDRSNRLSSEYISSQSITINFSKPYLGDRTDVETYIELMREALLQEIEAGKRIRI